MSFRRGYSPQTKPSIWGSGGISRLSALTGLSRTTITKGVKELRSRRKLAKPGEDRLREVGGGRKRIEQVDPAIPVLLEKILAENTAGDPMSLLRWTSKSTRTIAEELTRLGHPVSWVTVARCLDKMGYSLQANRKTKEGPQHGGCPLILMVMWPHSGSRIWNE